MTLVGLSTTQLTTMQSYMIRNTYDNAVALEAAETALIEAEIMLDSLPEDIDTDSFDCRLLPGLYSNTGFAVMELWRNPEIWAFNAQIGANNDCVKSNHLEISAEVPPAAYIVELLKISQKNVDSETVLAIFRITSLGIGHNPRTRVFLQSTYGRQFNVAAGIGEATGPVTINPQLDISTGRLSWVRLIPDN